jgi:hypothetical protein
VAQRRCFQTRVTVAGIENLGIPRQHRVVLGEKVFVKAKIFAERGV